MLAAALVPNAYAQGPGDALSAVGQKIFLDPALSASGKLSCATCHDPRHAYGPPDGKAVREGGKDLQTPGTRAVPSLRYTLNHTPVWSHEYQSDPIERLIAVESVPTGGFAWDGRFNTLQEQAAAPLLGPNEMANADPEAVVAKLARAPYADDLRATFGADVFDNPRTAFRKALSAIESFELHDPSFHPFSSKFDAYLDGGAQLSPQEARGLLWFTDPRRGNCDACHTASRGADGSHPLFTDYSFAALAVPRNLEVPANGDRSYYDLGLCGPLRRDQAAQPKTCGMFKTPTLRNVAVRKVFFHNGRFHALRDAVSFYAERDARPERWYARSGGSVELYDDLPPALRGNADHVDPPFDASHARIPALTPVEVDDIVAFLATLTDADVERR